MGGEGAQEHGLGMRPGVTQMGGSGAQEHGLGMRPGMTRMGGMTSDTRGDISSLFESCVSLP